MSLNTALHMGANMLSTSEMVFVEDVTMQLSDLTNSSSINRGAHILYMFDEPDKYFQNAVAFIREGIAKGHAILLGECKEFYQNMLQELTDFTPEQMRLLIFVDHDEFYSSDGFDAVKGTENVKKLFQDILPTYPTIRTWGHVIVYEKSIRDLVDYECNCDQFFEGKSVISVCCYNTLTTTSFLQNELLKFHNYFMLDEKITPSPLYNHKHLTNMTMATEETIRLTKIVAEFESLKKKNEELLIENKYHKEEEEYLRLAKQNAENANQMKTIFLSQISHDLRTPLNTILGYTQILLELHNKSSKQYNMLNHIHDSSYHLLDLIEELLDYSAIGGGNIKINMKPIHVESFLHECIHTISKIDNPNVQITVENADHDLFLEADEMRLKQIIQNLLVNAIKYNRPDGLIKISVKKENATGSIKISVSDTGIGLPDHEMDRLFEPFYRSERNMLKWKGTGLGLAIVANLSQKMNGEFGAFNNEAEGATFWVSFKQCESTLLSEKKKDPSQSAQKVVLYIEDQPENITLMREMLGTLDFISLFFETSGKSGLQKAIEQKPDLILLDLGLPDTNGKDVLLELKRLEATKTIPVLIISAESNELTKEDLLNHGCTDYLTKPINLKELRNTITKLLM